MRRRLMLAGFCVCLLAVTGCVPSGGRSSATAAHPPAGLGSGYVPTQLATGTDAVFAVGGRSFIPVIGRRVG